MMARRRHLRIFIAVLHILLLLFVLVMQAAPGVRRISFHVLLLQNIDAPSCGSRHQCRRNGRVAMLAAHQRQVQRQVLCASDPVDRRHRQIRRLNLHRAVAAPVPVHVGTLREPFVAHVAGVGPVPGVDQHVGGQVAFLSEGAVAARARMTGVRFVDQRRR